MLMPNTVSVLFERDAQPKVLTKGEDFSTDQAMWNALAKSFDLNDLAPIFPSEAIATKWKNAEREEMSRAWKYRTARSSGW